MKFLPVFLNVSDKKVLFIGAGQTARHKLRGVCRFTDNITVLAEHIDPAIKQMGFRVIIKKYERSDLEGYFLIYVCTGDRDLNQQIKCDAEGKGMLVNVCDCAGECDFISPAVFQQDNITVAVSSHATDVKKAVNVRNRVAEILTHDQVALKRQPVQSG